MAEFNRNLFAPWRMAYIDQLGDDTTGAGGDDCFLCRYAADAGHDRDHQVVRRGPGTLTVLNRFPYTTGHLLVAPLAHVAALDALDETTLGELTAQLRDAIRVLQAALHPDGMNVGLNLGRCAGAGLPGHLHWHVVPRWSGDTNFMSVTGDVRVVPMTLEAVFEKYVAAAAGLGLG